jgi:two-component system NtrC family sensor kinase
MHAYLIRIRSIKTGVIAYYKMHRKKTDGSPAIARQNEAIGEMGKDCSELNSPLTAILGNFKFYYGNSQDNPDYMLLDDIKICDRCRQIVKSLLTFLEAG